MDLPPVTDIEASLKFAELPAIYENVRQGAKKGIEGEKTAYKAVVEAAEKLGYEKISILKSGNTTAVVGYDADMHSAKVSLDPTKTMGDHWDNLMRQSVDHPIGGQVHGGLYGDLIKPNTQLMGQNMVEGVEGILHSYAYDIEQDLSVTIDGFSKAGGQGVMLNAEMITNNFFRDNDNIRLKNVNTFGTFGYADSTFIEKYNEFSQELGTQTWRMELESDVTPSILTPNGDRFYTTYEYGQAGEKVVLSDAEHKDGEGPQPHSFEAYQNAIDKMLKTNEMQSPQERSAPMLNSAPQL